MTTRPGDDSNGFVEVAVPLPLAGPLTYGVPDNWTGSVEPGCRVRVPVGRRTVTGVVLGLTEAPPEGVSIREVAESLDDGPVLPPELLELARFTSDYYLAPIGEVVRTMIPSDLEPWGRRRIRLTDSGAFAQPADEIGRRVLDRLRDAGPQRLGDLRHHLATSDFGASLEALEGRGWISIDGGQRRRGGRYRQAIELTAGSESALLERCGRSAPARELVSWLHGLGRPVATEEALAKVGCGPGVVRRLVKLGVLRSFTEVRRLDLAGQALDHREPPKFELRPDQATATERLVELLDEHRYGAFLLAGITGSGKTEVYLRAAAHARELERSVIILVPEIALVPALASTLRSRFGDECAILHSALSTEERKQEWERIRDGRAKVVLGPRSAIFAPVVDLGLVVVDEEHDGAYKQEVTPRYNGRDLALVRSAAAEAVAVLTSATPSFESRQNVERGKLEPLLLTHRAGRAGLPVGELVDLRQEATRRVPGEISFSGPLLDAIDRTLAAGDQVMILRNRRGYAPQLLCRACGEDHRCEECGLPRTYHRRSNVLVCHYCGSRLVAPRRCGSCREEALEPIGAGTERVEERFAEHFPKVTVSVLDRDTAHRRGGAAAALEGFASGETRVLIGTQMIAKGHHFPNVALAAVLSADTYLGFPDFRAVEKTFALLTQLSGRAGRGDRPGRVVIQTYHPDHYAIRAAIEHDDRAFVDEEMRFRRVFHYPPFTKMASVLVRDRNRDRARDAIEEIAATIDAPARRSGIRISGPAPAPLERLRGQWRYQLLARGSSGRAVRELLEGVAAQGKGPAVAVDVDPIDLL